MPVGFTIDKYERRKSFKNYPVLTQHFDLEKDQAFSYWNRSSVSDSRQGFYAILGFLCTGFWIALRIRKLYTEYEHSIMLDCSGVIGFCCLGLWIYGYLKNSFYRKHKLPIWLNKGYIGLPNGQTQGYDIIPLSDVKKRYIEALDLNNKSMNYFLFGHSFIKLTTENGEFQISAHLLSRTDIQHINFVLDKFLD